MYLGETLERKRERIYLEKFSKCPKSFVLVCKGFRGLYNEKLAFWLLATG